MPEAQDTEERPCLHCMMVELIENFFAEYPIESGEQDTIDTDEVIIALAKTVADLTCSQNGTVRQQIIETLMREIITKCKDRIGTAYPHFPAYIRIRGQNVHSPLVEEIG